VWLLHPKRSFHSGPHARVSASAEGVLVVLVAIQLFVLGLYLAPVFKA